jgi:predicted phage terminase large subunit-like protein
LKLAALDAAGWPLWPGRWSLAALAQRRSEIGERAFAQEFLNQPVSERLQVFKPDCFRSFDFAAVEYRDGGWHLGGQPLEVVLGVDPAIGKTERHDYFAVCAVGLLRGTDGQPPQVYLLEMLRRREGFSQQLELLGVKARQWLPRIIGIEATAYQLALAQEAWRRGLPVKALADTRRKAARIDSLNYHAAAGRLYLPAGGEWVAEFREEAAAYPAGAHDDQLDALARALEVGLPLVSGIGEVLTADEQREGVGGF